MGLKNISSGLIILFLFITLGISHAEMTTSQIAKKYSPAVVTIIALDENDQPLSLGSGFFINSSGDIATNHHVLEGCAKAIIKTTKGEKGTVIEIIRDDSELDLLIAKTSLKNTPSVPLGDSDAILAGEDIIAIGNPAGLEGTVSKGIISGIRKVEDYKFIQITAPISPGSSGGPVFNLAGKVIGIATAYLDSGQNLNFAMPVNYLKSLKESRIKLASLPRARLKTTSENKALVEATDIRINYCGDRTVCGVDLLLNNKSNYPISNIKLFFIYKLRIGEYTDEYMHLWNATKFDETDKMKPIKEWDKVLSYSANTFKGTILPKLALQYKTTHHVKYCGYYNIENTLSKCTVEVRILDYEIDRTGSSPADLLFK